MDFATPGSTSNPLTVDNCAGIWPVVNQSTNGYHYYSIKNIMHNSSGVWKGQLYNTQTGNSLNNTQVYVRLLAYVLKSVC